MHHIECRGYDPIAKFPFATEAGGALQLGIPKGDAPRIRRKRCETVKQRIRRRPAVEIMLVNAGLQVPPFAIGVSSRQIELVLADGLVLAGSCELQALAVVRLGDEVDGAGECIGTVFDGHGAVDNLNARYIV